MRRQNWWARSALWRQSAVGVSVLLAAMLQAIDRYKMVPDWKWAHSNALLFIVVALSAFLVLGNTVGDVIHQRRTHAGEGRRLDIYRTALGALVTLAAETDLVITELGANVFLVKKGLGYREWKVGGRSFPLGRRPRLERIERVRLADNPMMSAVPWTEGKGVIGDCWERARPEYVHWAPLAKRWSGKTITPQQWAKIKPIDKAGFSLEEFMTMVGKYAEIKAVPLKDHAGNVIGVVAVDRVWRSSGPQGRLLNSGAVEDTVTSAARVLQSVVAGR